MKSYLWLLCLLVLAGAGAATTIHIPADQPTIQAGLDAASDFDTVQIASGEYTGPGNRDLDFKGKKITLLGSGGWYGGNVWINCEGTEADQHNAFWFHSREDTFSVIDGISIRGSYKKSTQYPTMFLGAIQCDTSGPIVRNCQIAGNAGYGVFATSNGHIYIRDCSINGNWNGIRAGRDPMFNGSNITVQRTLIVENDSAGVQLMYYGDHLIDNCTIAWNGVQGIRYELDMPVVGYDAAVAATRIVRTIVANNGQRGISAFIFGANTVRIECTDSWGQGAYDFPSGIASPGDSLSNFSADPLLCSPSHAQYAIQDNSPCAPAFNECHELIGALPEGCNCCGTVVASGNVDGWGIVDVSDLSMLVAYLTATPPRLPCPAAANINGLGIIDITDLSMLVTYLTLGTSSGWSCPPLQ